MKHQYVGDINDYRKYALLRALSADGATRIGVCWMLTPDDGGSDGSKLDYLNQPERYRAIDPELFDILRRAASKPDDRRLGSVEESQAIPGAEYFNAPLFDGLAPRRAYILNVARAFRSTHLVFFDPDNGLETSLAMGRARSSKYLYLEEVTFIYEGGRSVLIYQHFPRVQRSEFIAHRIEQLRFAALGCALWTFATANVVFFLLVHPDSPARLAISAIEACSRWEASFISGN